VAASFVEKLQSHRLTLTLPVFNHARQVVFLAAGKEKAAVLKELQTMESSPARVPFQLIKPHDGRLKFFLDEAAAAFIDRTKEG
jgi:6-phosphogluconolactonase